VLKLTAQSLQDRKAWEAAGVKLPGFDYAAMCAHTKEHPVWVHFGAGNIFRGFIARLQQELLNSGKAKSGVIAADTFDFGIIDQIYAPHDNLTMLVSLKPDGSTDKEIVASIAEGIKADGADEKQMARLNELFTNPELQMASFTITEKGYALTDLAGNFFPVVQEDMKNGPDHARHAMSIVTALMFRRYKAGGYPFALCSMDNCSHNGQKLQDSVLTVAEAWQKNGFVDEGFVAYLKDASKVSFPWSMIDKITPRPSEIVEKQLAAAGIEDMAPVVTAKNTFIAPFVNAEVPQYLVVEDRFPNGRPPLEEAGVYFTDRDTVNNTERMKVTTCLNPLHTALAVYGCLLGYTSIAAEMQDADLKKLVERIGYDEGMPVVVDPKILSPMDFIHEVIDQRLPNPFIPDAPQRIATDTSQKLPIRFGETIKSYLSRPDLDVQDLVCIPLALAGWCRYLLGVDDKCEPMQVSSDPMLADLQKMLAGVKVGEPASVGSALQPILSNPALFAVDLYEAGLGGKVEGMFKELIAGPGAVRTTLQKYVNA
jgi:fructuronate reductase